MVSGIERSRDNLIRNATENQDRFTNRNVRKICKIWSESDWNLQDDLAELVEKLQQVESGKDILEKVDLQTKVLQLLKTKATKVVMPLMAAVVSPTVPSFIAVEVDSEPINFSAEYSLPVNFNQELLISRRSWPEQITTTEAPMDSLSEFMLNFTT